MHRYLAPKPENDFAQYVQTYHETCRHYFEGIEATAGKWMFRDLVPGMSDFDTRFIVRDGMTADDWCRMATAIGEAHLSLCERYPCWARNLEHLPGINLTWSELTSTETFYPEYQQWSFYYTERPDMLRTAQQHLAKRCWGPKDEYFHLKKFCYYFGRYDRKIDPPINLGIHSEKYALHSRLLHYFAPSIQSAICLLERQNFAGKFDTLEMAEQRYPQLACWPHIHEILGCDYRDPRFYEEMFLSTLEDELEDALRVVMLEVANEISLIADAARMDPPAWKVALQRVSIDPRLLVFEATRFSRLMKGRLLFYARAPSRFDTTWLIANELKRIGRNFFDVPFRQYWRLRNGQAAQDSKTILENLRGNPLSDVEVEAAREFVRLTPGFWEPGKEKEMALAIVAIFDDFYKALSRISQAIREEHT